MDDQWARDQMIEHYCEVMHDAYEKAAVGNGWETQAASRKPWADVPEANKATMRAAVAALLAALPVAPEQPTQAHEEWYIAPSEIRCPEREGGGKRCRFVAGHKQGCEAEGDPCGTGDPAVRRRAAGPWEPVDPAG